MKYFIVDPIDPTEHCYISDGTLWTQWVETLEEALTTEMQFMGYPLDFPKLVYKNKWEAYELLPDNSLASITKETHPEYFI